MNKIFIQIASYRDPQLIPTIKDCIANAAEPNNLIFGICRQFHPDDGFDSLDEFKDDKRFRVVDVPWDKAEGVCWARNAVQQLYQGETYTLQLDSHHRFAKDWDTTLINMLTQLQKKGHAKPLLTTYASSFDPDNDPAARTKPPWKMDFDRFIPEGAVFFLPSAIDNWRELTEPIPARFYSAHFAFSIGQFAVEVQHDPEYYFHGEEISIAVRAYTHGYDLFHPHKTVVWHEYTRKNRAKHWDDHSPHKHKQIEKPWHLRNKECHERNRKLFEMDGLIKDIDFGKYDFGTARSVSDYEKYAGISFKMRAAQEHTIKNKLAPCPVPDTEEEWVAGFARKMVVPVNVSLTEIEHGDDVKFWFFGIHDKDGKEIYRKDRGKNQIKKFVDNGRVFFRENIVTTQAPKTYMIWPMLEEGWGKQIVKPVPGFESF